MIFLYYHPPPDEYLCVEAERVVAMQGVAFEQAGRKFAVVVTDYVPVENCSLTPAETFAVRKSSIEGVGYIVGYMHSHESGSPEPSEADLAGLPEGQLGAVWCNGGVRWYTPGDREQLVPVANQD
jgi:proteasome lid subunit RPN8/RPN11